MNTALSKALAGGHEQCAEALLEAGADGYGYDDGGMTALMMAFRSRYYYCCQLIILAGADVNGVDGNGRTCLFYAAAANNIWTVKLLLQAGSYVNIRSTEGFNALSTYLFEVSRYHHKFSKKLSMILLAAGEKVCPVDTDQCLYQGTCAIPNP